MDGPEENKWIGKLKTGLRWTKNIYLASMAAVCLHIGYDFFTSNLPRLERGGAVHYLQVRRFEVETGKGVKHLTLLGENHHYTFEEHDLAKHLVNTHTHFASEAGEGYEYSIDNILFRIIFKSATFPYYAFKKLGSGRWYEPVSRLAMEKGYRVVGLENDPLLFLSEMEKVNILWNSLLSMAVAPIGYYQGKNESPYHPQEFTNMPYREGLNKRDKAMAKNLAELLREKEVDNLLVNVGAAHLEGVIRNLGQELNLKSAEYGHVAYPSPAQY